MEGAVRPRSHEIRVGIRGAITVSFGRLHPFDGALYAFTNRQRNKIKCLLWEDNGFVLYYKALAEEKFRWPRRGEELIALTGQQINWLLDGYDITLLSGHRKLHYESVF